MLGEGRLREAHLVCEFIHTEFGAEKMGSNKQPLFIGEESEQLSVLNENHFIMHFNSPFNQLRLTYT
jgi:hypothetical protein